MRIACGVTTAPRRADYLPQTLESLRTAGFENIVVRNDEESRLGPYRNFKALLSELLIGSDAEAIAVFQDDVIVSGGLRRWIDENLWPADAATIGVVSLYCSEYHEFNRSGWHKLPLRPNDCRDDAEDIAPLAQDKLRQMESVHPTRRVGFDSLHCVRKFQDCAIFVAHYPLSGEDEWRWFWARKCHHGPEHWFDMSEMKAWGIAYGACGYLIPRSSAHAIVEKCRHPESRSKTDQHVAMVCQQQGLDYWMHTPSLVQHIGAVSTLHDHGLNANRTSKLFVENVASLE